MRRAYSFRTQLLAVALGPLLLACALIGALAWQVVTAAIERSALSAVGVAADARAEELVGILGRRLDRARLTLLSAQKQCRESSNDECYAGELDDFVHSEGALGARLTLADGRRVVTGEAESTGGERAMAPGELARFDTERSPSRYFEIEVKSEGATLIIRHSAAIIDEVFGQSTGLGDSGETFLAGAHGALLTSPRHAIDPGEGAVNRCGAGGDAELITGDSRGVRVLRGFRHIPLVDACAVAQFEAAEAFRPATELQGSIFRVTLLVVLGAVILSFVLGDRLARPVAELTHTAERLARGEFPGRGGAQGRGSRELKQLAETVESMARSLEEKSATLEADKERLADAARLRDEMMAILGHDLRSPLTAIVATAGVLERRFTGDEKTQQSIGRITSAAQRANRMIAALLDFTRARTSGLAVERRPCDLEAVVRGAVEEMSAAHPERRIEFVSEGPVLGAFDPDRVSQVMSNLLGNAQQHTPDSEVIRVTLESTAGGAQLSVSNGGPAIPPDLLPRLFEPFKRSNPRERGASANLGLGLYITRAIVVAHEGQISVTSSAADGTRVLVQLPRA